MMASPTMSHRPSKRRRLMAQANDDGGSSLPRDELEEVLLRLPSKPLARLRAISHSWRSVISAPHFVAEHARRCEADSLLVVPVYAAADDVVDFKLVDMASGAVVAQLDGQSNGRFIGTSGGLLCSVIAGTPGNGDTAAIRVLNPATGAVTSITAGTATADGELTSSTYVFGQVPKTGEHKVLRVYTSSDHNEQQQSCEILTLGGREQSWRPAASPPVLVGTEIPRHRAVTQGVVHFMTSDKAEYDGIASFDLATEQWRPTLLQGPVSSDGRHCLRTMLSLVNLNGFLVYVHPDYLSKSIDIWVLAEGTWFRIKSLLQGSVIQGGETMVQPLMVLDDGCIALWVGAPNGIVRLYDPRTDSCKNVVSMGGCCGSFVGLYNGSLLGFMK